jgi:hypothetical protein
MNWLWSKVSKVLGVVCLLGGGTVSLGLLTTIIATQVAGAGLAVLSVLLVFFGLVPAMVGGWLLHTGARAEQQVIREQFFQLLHASQGRMSVLDFARVARLEPTIARRHLDIWAKEFSAEFEVTDRGDIYYVFTTEPMALPENRALQSLSQALKQWLQT